MWLNAARWRHDVYCNLNEHLQISQATWCTQKNKRNVNPYMYGLCTIENVISDAEMMQLFQFSFSSHLSPWEARKRVCTPQMGSTKLVDQTAWTSDVDKQRKLSYPPMHAKIATYTGFWAHIFFRLKKKFGERLLV